MDLKRVVENLNADVRVLKEKVADELLDKMLLENTVKQQEKELLACENSTWSKGLVSENIQLKSQVEVLTESLEIKENIINEMRRTIEMVRSIKPFLVSSHVVELHKQGITTLKIAQYYGTTKAVVLDVLKKSGQYKQDNPIANNGQREDEQREREQV